MVFSTSASAFLHFGEHQHEQSHSLNQYDTEAHHHGNYDDEDDHSHHFNLHVLGDLVEYDLFSFMSLPSLSNCDCLSQLISRTYTPPIPPPNA